METRSVSKNDALFKTQEERQQGIYLLFDNGQGPYLPDLKNSHNSEHVEYRYMAIKDDRGIFLRDREAYDIIIDQFYVTNGLRYLEESDTGKTWCNIYMADILGASGLTLFKEYSDTVSDLPKATWGEIYKEPGVREEQGEDTNYCNANELYNYFMNIDQYDVEENRNKHGIIKVDADVAQQFADEGIPTFGLKWNEAPKNGHCIVLRPIKPKDLIDDRNVLAYTQAGGTCLLYHALDADAYLPKYKYFVHVKDEYLPYKLLWLIQDDLDKVKEINRNNVYLQERYDFFKYWFFE